MDILRITTAGSVDDGKSTLIGRLLYDTRSIAKDKLEAIENTSKRKGLDFTDLSLLTDGLIAEREQGITIDVAHIYFSTANRKYIIADTPGHIEYTRNMITGASNARVSIILVDARKGVVEQTRRHFYIASLLRIEKVVVCVNKMDLVNYSEDIYQNIVDDFKKLREKAGFDSQQIRFIPLVAKDGDNVVFSSLRMPWYGGETLLEFLENTPASAAVSKGAARFSIQFVIRPHNDVFHDFRGYAGKLASGELKKGDEIIVLPSLKTSAIKNIFVNDEARENAVAKESVVITLNDDIDISRGDMIVKATERFFQLSQCTATICWMDESSMPPGRTYLLQHGSNRVKAKISSVLSVLDIHNLEKDEQKKNISLNDISDVQIKLARPIFADAYAENPANGSFILIDEQTNNTVAVGFVLSQR
jgi:sulfate adenylyltransferase subunit 1